MTEPESAIGWIVRAAGETGLQHDVSWRRAGADSYRDWLNTTYGTQRGVKYETVRVRVTVEPESMEEP